MEGLVVQSHRRPKQGAMIGLVASAALIFAAMVWFAYYQFLRPSTEDFRSSFADGRNQDGPYTGAVVMPERTGGRCRKFRFDNISGTIDKGTVIECTDSTPGMNSTEGRMNAIRDAFQRK